MLKQPLVSIIIPTYNRAHLLPRAIESVLNQTYQNIELIIVDDASKDATQEIIKNYVNKDKRIIALKNHENKQSSYSRNLAINHSHGDFLMFLDDDCEYLPKNISENITAMFSSPSPSIIFSNMWIEKEGAATMLPLSLKSKALTSKNIFNSKYPFLEPSTWFCHKTCIKNINGFDPNLKVFVDIDLMMRAFFNDEKIYFLNAPLTIKHRAEGTSTITPRYIKGKEAFLEKNLPLFKEHKKYLARFYYALGKDLLKLNEFNKASDYFWKAFSCNPFQIRYLLLHLTYKKKKCL